MKTLYVTCITLVATTLLTLINYILQIDNVAAQSLYNPTVLERKTEVLSQGVYAENQYTIVSPKNLISGYEPQNPDGTVNVVVEIPAGTLAKWEVSKPDGKLKWEFREGKPRVVQYLGYPGNYGMIPRSHLPKELGGDGDPVDAIVLGAAVPRGSVVPVKLIGILKLLDSGEQDDKLLGVIKDSPFFEVNSIADLDKQFPGVTTILETWFSNYKGINGEMESKGFAEKEEALKVFNFAVEAFSER
ncbi:MAG: inorganic diphosphatase [Lyngbya sp.]|nr:inorganic diphosphatase [Lyngbya sp.]